MQASTLCFVVEPVLAAGMTLRFATIVFAAVCVFACDTLDAQPPSMADRGADALSGPAWAPRHLHGSGQTPMRRFPAVAPRPGGERFTTRLAPPTRPRLGPAAPMRPGVIPAGLALNNAQNSADGVTMHLDNVDVRQVLELMSRTYGKSILVAPEVAGKVTVNFEKVPVDQALTAILKLGNLVAQQEGPLLYVYSEASFPKNDLQVKVIPLDFASAEEVLPTIEGMLTSSGKVYARKINSEDNRFHREALIVSDIAGSLVRIEQYIQQTDVPPLQVMIEAHVLKIDLNDDLRHGVNYKQAMSALGSSALEFEATGFADPNASPALFARIQGARVDGLIHLLKSTTDAKTLASPRVLVVNGQKARIQVGNQLGYKVVTVTETAAVEEVKFLEVGIVLEVTPRISRDGRVMMRVKPKVSDGLINTDTLLPEEQTSEIESDVLLADGQGVVIGGLIQEKDSDIQQKVPWLGDLYIVGRLFQKRSRVKERSEIVVTLVPRIVGASHPATESDIIDAERSQFPLFQGPLNPTYRPWEPELLDAVDNPYHRNHGIGCGLFYNRACDCGVPAAPPVAKEPLPMMAPLPEGNGP